MQDNELILLKEVKKYSEINDKLLLKNDKLKAELALKEQNYRDLAKVTTDLSKTVKFLEGAHSEKVAERAKALYEEYVGVIKTIKQRCYEASLAELPE